MNQNHQIMYHLRDLVPFVQFKKREKHPWKSDTKVAKVCHFIKTIFSQRVFFTFFEKVGDILNFCLSCQTTKQPLSQFNQSNH